MKNLILNLSKTPFAKIKDNYFNKINHDKIFIEINNFLNELSEFNNQNPDINLCTLKHSNGGAGILSNTAIPIQLQVETHNLSFKSDDTYYQDTSDYSKIILFNNNSFSLLIKDKHNASSYVVNASEHNGFRIEYFEKNESKNTLSFYQVDNDVFLSDSNNLTVSNSFKLEKDNVIDHILKIVDYNNDSFYIQFNKKKSQLHNLKVVNGNVEEVILNENIWFALSEDFKNKYRGRSALTLTEFNEISEHIKPKYELNLLEFDKSPWAFLDVDILVSLTNEALHTHRNKFYIIPENIIEVMDSICKETIHNDIVKESDTSYKSLAFFESNCIEPNKIDYKNTNLETIKNIYTTLTNNFSEQVNIISKKQSKNKPI